MNKKDYLGKNNEINKKKYKKSYPYGYKLNAGNVEQNISRFNNSVNYNAGSSTGDAGASAGSGMGESLINENLTPTVENFKKCIMEHYNLFERLADE